MRDVIRTIFTCIKWFTIYEVWQK